MSLKTADVDQLVDLIRREGRKCSDAPRLVCIADALCQLAVVGQGDGAAALQVRLNHSLLSLLSFGCRKMYVHPTPHAVQIVQAPCPQAAPQIVALIAGFDGFAHIQAANCEEGCC